MNGIALCAKQINHGQSEIWLGSVDENITERRTLATNEVINVTRRLSPPELFEAFNKDYHTAIGHIAALNAPNLDEIATELKLKR